MISQEELAKIGRATLAAREANQRLPGILGKIVDDTIRESVKLPTEPGSYLAVREGYPDRTAQLGSSGWKIDSALGKSGVMKAVDMAAFLSYNGRELKRVYTQVEAQQLAADAVDLARHKWAQGADEAAWRRKGQTDIVSYIESVNWPGYSGLVNELIEATAPGGILHVKVPE